MNKVLKVDRDCPLVVALSADIVAKVPGAARDVIGMSIVSRFVDRVWHSAVNQVTRMVATRVLSLRGTESGLNIHVSMCQVWLQAWSDQI